MKKTVVLKLLAVGLLLGAVSLAGCSEKKDAAEAPQPREVAQRVEEAAREEAQMQSEAKANDAMDAAAGEAAFGAHCAACHPNGGNIINSEKSLQRASLESHGITSPEDIVTVMRNPGEGMPAFSEETLPEEQALAIAQYVWETFK